MLEVFILCLAAEHSVSPTANIHIASNHRTAPDTNTRGSCRCLLSVGYSFTSHCCTGQFLYVLRKQKSQQLEAEEKNCLLYDDSGTTTDFIGRQQTFIFYPRLSTKDTVFRSNKLG